MAPLITGLTLGSMRAKRNGFEAYGEPSKLQENKKLLQTFKVGSSVGADFW
jgi:hypothetical protein